MTQWLARRGYYESVANVRVAELVDAKELSWSKPVSFLGQTCEAFDKTNVRVQIPPLTLKTNNMKKLMIICAILYGCNGRHQPYIPVGTVMVERYAGGCFCEYESYQGVNKMTKVFVDTCGQHKIGEIER